MLEIKNVSKSFDEKQILKKVSFQLDNGLHYIVGPSGCGKSTLLNIMSGMDKAYDGDVFYNSTQIKALDQKEMSYFYNNIFGFVCQNYNLIEHKTVLENVCLPTYIKDKQEVSMEKIMKELDIYRLANHKVNCLSGGQKQRVAFARELMKNPQVIIADEPTSALDERSASIMMDMLKKLAKHKIVIVVTHDVSLIHERDHILEIDNGFIDDSHPTKVRSSKAFNIKMSSISMKRAMHLANVNLRSSLGHLSIIVITGIIASLLLLTTCSGLIGKTSSSEFDKLFDIYGEGLLDLNLTSSFTSAAGTDNKDEKKPNADVKQDISKLYDKYVNDDRVKFALYTPAFNEIEIDTGAKKYKIETSNSVPIINKLLTGNYPSNNNKEVLVPESLVKKMGKTNEDIIGTKITFNGSKTTWQGETPTFKKISAEVEIVGVIDTNMMYEYEGKKMEYSIDDSFIFSKAVLDDFKQQTDTQNESTSFTLRAKTPQDLISIKDELNKDGIVPIGQFELVEDYLKLSNQSTSQSSFVSGMMAVIAIALSLLVYTMLAILRKREFSIYKLSGFHPTHINKVLLFEIINISIISVVSLIVVSPILNIVMKSLFSIDILNIEYLLMSAIILVILNVLGYILTSFIVKKVNVMNILNTGDKS